MACRPDGLLTTRASRRGAAVLLVCIVSRNPRILDRSRIGGHLVGADLGLLLTWAC
jgi:hypothetical protein